MIKNKGVDVQLCKCPEEILLKLEEMTFSIRMEEEKLHLKLSRREWGTLIISEADITPSNLLPLKFSLPSIGLKKISKALRNSQNY